MLCFGIGLGWDCSPEALRDMKALGMILFFLSTFLLIWRSKLGVVVSQLGEFLITFKSLLVICVCMGNRDWGKCLIWGGELMFMIFAISFFSLFGVFPKPFRQDIMSSFLQAMNETNKQNPNPKPNQKCKLYGLQR